MKRLLGILLIGILALQLSAFPVMAKSRSSRSSFSVPKIRNSNPKYIIPRKSIPVPKTQNVNPYIKKNGTVVPGYQRAPKNSLKPYYNPLYQKK